MKRQVKKQVKIGTRDSKLALKQAEMVKISIEENHPEIECVLVPMKTTGDIILDKTLDKIGGKGLFVKELDKALMDGRTDISVHSLKDMTVDVPEELPIVAYSKRDGWRDVLVLPKSGNMDKRRPIGSSSLRRTMQLKDLFPEFVVKPIRGNVLSRLEKLDRGDFSALVLAEAGLRRLRLEDRISRRFDDSEMVSAVGQGIIAVQGRAGEDYSYLKEFNDSKARIEGSIERQFLLALEGGCSDPIGCHARLEMQEEGVKESGRVHIHGFFGTRDLAKSFTGEETVYESEAEAAAHALGEELLQRVTEYQRKKGRVFLVGAGPGDEGLLTLKGKRLIETADVVIYDNLVGPGIIGMIPSTTRTIYVGKISGSHPIPQWEINEIILKEATRGNRVVRLKGGDPFVFGRGGEELELLAENNIRFEVIPGITSAVAVPAYSGIPVTHRDFASSFHVITGHRRGDYVDGGIDYETLSKLTGTLVFLMGVAAMEEICSGLMEGGMENATPVAVIERGTLAKQRRIVSTLDKVVEDAKSAGIGAPAIIVVGQVCSLSESLSWFEKLPLAGIRIGITRPIGRASRLKTMLMDRGAEVISFPAISTRVAEDDGDFLEAMDREFAWILFTSREGVRAFFQKMARNNMDIRDLKEVKIAVIGKATEREVKNRGLMVDYIPDKYCGETLARELRELVDTEEDSILIPRSTIGSEDVIIPLMEGGIDYVDLGVYDTDLCGESLLTGEVTDMMIFTSASTVRGFVSFKNEADYSHILAVCIGEMTSREARKYGMKIETSDEATIDSLVEKVVQIAGH